MDSTPLLIRHSPKTLWHLFYAISLMSLITNATPSTSVIICTRNRPIDIVSTLDSLSKQTTLPSELIIVDASDTPLIKNSNFNNAWSLLPTAITRIYLTSRPGLTYQRNRGINHATGEIIYFFDDDVELASTYLAIMNGRFAAHPQYLGGMGNITNLEPYNPLKYYLRTLFLLPRTYASGNFTASGMPTHAYGTTTFKDVAVLGGCCMAFKRSALIKEPFDEKLHGYCYLEDVDISWRISRHGPLFYEPTAQLKHHTSPEARDAMSERRAMYLTNYTYLFFKNIYPTSKLSIIPFAWSIAGLFAEATIHLKTSWIHGYLKALKHILTHGTNTPYPSRSTKLAGATRP